jgi:DNA-binding transcriptional LysR family regulator
VILKYLRQFTAVAEEGSVVRAAVRLRVAQPALSRQMQALERQFGEPLFIREPRGVRPTPAGATLLVAAYKVLQELEAAVREARLAAAGMTGVLRIGLGRAAVDSSRVGRALATVRVRYPDVQLVVSELAKCEHEAALTAGAIDLGIAMYGDEPHDMLRATPIYRDSIDSVLLPTGHPLAATEAVDIPLLRASRLPLLSVATSNGFPGLFRALEAAGLSWDTLTSVESVYTAVAAGDGWTMTTTSLRESPPHGTAVRPLSGFSVPVAMTAAWRVDDDSPLLANVVEVLLASARGNDGSAPVGAEPSADRESSATWPSIDLVQLRGLVTTVRDGSVSSAAEHLELTQSAVSRQLRALERDVGCSLLRRTAKGVVATPAGDVLARRGARVLSLIDAASVRARHVATASPRVCRIATLPAEMTDDLPVRLRTHMANHHPEISLDLHEMTSGAQVTALHEREIDIGVLGGFYGVVDDPTIASVALTSDPLECAAIAATHPLASRSWLTPADLQDLPFFFLSRTTSPRFYDAVFEHLAHAGVVPMVNGEFNGFRTAWRMVADSNGWTVAPQSQRRNPPAGLRAIPIQGVSIEWGLRLVWRSSERDTGVQVVLDAIRQGLGE